MVIFHPYTRGTNRCYQAHHAVLPHNPNIEFCVARNRENASSVIALRALNDLDETQTLDFDGKFDNSKITDFQKHLFVADFDVFKLKSGTGITFVTPNPNEYLWNRNVYIQDCPPLTYTRRGQTEIVKRYNLPNGHYKIVPKRYNEVSLEPKFNSHFIHIIPAK